MHLVNILRIITFSFLVGHSILTISDFNGFRFFGTPCICQSFMHSWEPTECLGIQILTIKLLLVISIVFVFFGTPCIVNLMMHNLKLCDTRLSLVSLIIIFESVLTYGDVLKQKVKQNRKLY